MKIKIKKNVFIIFKRKSKGEGIINIKKGVEKAKN